MQVGELRTVETRAQSGRQVQHRLNSPLAARAIPYAGAKPDDEVTAQPEVLGPFPGRRSFPREAPCCPRFPRSGEWHWPDGARIAAGVPGSPAAPLKPESFPDRK